MLRQLICAVAALSLLAACSSEQGASTGAGANGMQPGMQSGAGAGAGAGGMAAAGQGQVGPGTQEDLVRSVGDRIYFRTDSSTITDEARTTLDHQAAWLQQHPQVNVLIAGNCDERGTEEYNLALGQRRANADRDYLVAHGIAANRIRTISYGKDRPTVLGDTPAAWAKNRNAITYVR